MGADAIAELRPPLRELMAERQGADDPAGELCLTLSVPGRAKDRWVQVLTGTLNAAYPHAERPEVRFAPALREHAASFRLLDWEPGLFAAFSFDALPIDDLAGVIDRVFSLVMETDPDAGVDVEFMRL